MKAVLLLQIATASMLLLSCTSNAVSETHVFDLDIVDRYLGDRYKRLTVTQNDTVIMHITSNEEGVFHLHGYNLNTSLDSVTTAKLEFRANATGKFDFAFHSDMVNHGHSQNHHPVSSKDECVASLPVGAKQPTIELHVMAGLKPGEIKVMIETTNFQLGATPVSSGLPLGHWHLVLDDRLIGMYTEPEAIVMLDKGEHEVSVNLVDLGHCSYNSSATEIVRVDGKANTNHSHEGENKQEAVGMDVVLGSIEVHPR
ncbi:hypothetical protein M1N24_00900 [Dehalococcoidia bacterium]|nr:hypothetical protein [Dehalococcoidia bacterium]